MACSTTQQPAAPANLRKASCPVGGQYGAVSEAYGTRGTSEQKFDGDPETSIGTSGGVVNPKRGAGSSALALTGHYTWHAEPNPSALAPLWPAATSLRRLLTN